MVQRQSPQKIWLIAFEQRKLLHDCVIMVIAENSGSKFHCAKKQLINAVVGMSLDCRIEGLGIWAALASCASAQQLETDLRLRVEG